MADPIHQTVLLYTVAFDVPGSLLRRVMAKLLVSSLLRNREDRRNESGSRSSLFVNQETGQALKNLWTTLIETGMFGSIIFR
jgi:hypothetical protein